MRDKWEALSTDERREKARKLAEDIEMFEESPERLKDDIAALVDKDSYQEAVDSLE